MSIPNLILAEDINIAFPLTYWTTTADADPIRGNRSKLAGPVKPQIIKVAENYPWVRPQFFPRHGDLSEVRPQLLVRFS